MDPWEIVHTDMIGPWNAKFKMPNKTVMKQIQASTIIGKATTWPEIAIVDDKTSENVAITLNKTWLCCYPRHKQIVHDNGGEFNGLGFQELASSFGIKVKPSMVKNPRTNSTAERMHLKAGDMLRTMEFS